MVCPWEQREVDIGLEEAGVTVCVQQGVDAFLSVAEGRVGGSLQQLHGQLSGLAVQIHLKE